MAKSRLLLSEGYRPDEVSAEYVRPHSPSKKQGSRVWVGAASEGVRVGVCARDVASKIEGIVTESCLWVLGC